MEAAEACEVEGCWGGGGGGGGLHGGGSGEAACSCKPRDPLSKATLKLSHQKAIEKNGINACIYKVNQSKAPP